MPYKTNYKKLNSIGRELEDDCNVSIDELEDDAPCKLSQYVSTPTQAHREAQGKLQQSDFTSTSLAKVQSNTVLTRKEEEVEVEQPVSQQRGIDLTQVISYGLKLIVINDIDNNFLPVMSLNFSNFKVQVDSNAKQMCAWTDLKTSANFFNVNIGVWEPFIEKFTIKVMMNQEILAKKQNLQFAITTPLNINITEKLLQNIYESNHAWIQVSSQFDDFMQEFEQATKALAANNPFKHLLEPRKKRSSTQHQTGKRAQTSRKTIMLNSFGLNRLQVLPEMSVQEEAMMLHTSSDPKVNEE